MNKSIDYHKDHKEWLSRLDFYTDEIKFFFKELNKVFDQNKENLAWMEFIDEYEAILDKKSDRINTLRKRIVQGEKEIAEAKEGEEIIHNHHQLHLDFIEFEKSFLTMKQGFKRFASHND